MKNKNLPRIQTLGKSGHLSLGKIHAGKMVLVDQLDDGTWLIKVGKFIPDSEKWLHEEKNLASLKRALDWAEKNKPQDNFLSLLSLLVNQGSKD